jgi:sulfopyruvate decarboxylase subunit alpha
VMIQCTGLFESGDALRNTLHEWTLPIYAIVGYRSYLSQDNLPGDTSLVFTEPILQAWKLDVRFIEEASELGGMADHYRACQATSMPGVALIAEGRS